MHIDGEGCPGAVFPSTVPRIQLLREVQQSHPFSPVQRAISSNPSFIQRIELQRKLEGHNGCVNACAFTPDGQHLLSGSDDKQIKIWNWQQGKELFSWDSGHWANVFQAKAITDTVHPNSQNSSPSPTADLTVVSSAADGQIRIAHIFEGRVAHRRVGSHDGRAHKLALLPENPSRTFLSCGEDGKVIHYDLRLPKPSTPLMTVCHAFMKSRALELFSVACNPINSTEFCIGGQDEVIRVFDLRKTTTTTTCATGGGATATTNPRALPLAFISPHRLAHPQTLIDAHVTAAVYSCKGEILASYNDENIYLIAAGIASGLRGQKQENQFIGGAGGVVQFDPSAPSSSTLHGTRGTIRSSVGRRRSNPRESNPPFSGGRARGGRAQRRTGRGRDGARGDNRRQQQDEQRVHQRHHAEADSRWRRDQRAATRQSHRAVELDTTLRMRYFSYLGRDGDTYEGEGNSKAATIHGQNKADEDLLDTPDSFLARLYAVQGRGNRVRDEGNVDLDSSSSDEEGGGGGDDDVFSDMSGESLDSDSIRDFIMRLAEDISEGEGEGRSDSDSEEEQEESDEEDDKEESEDEDEVDGEGTTGRNSQDVLASRWPLPRLAHWNNADGSSQLLNNLEAVSVDRQGGVLQLYQGIFLFSRFFSRQVFFSLLVFQVIINCIPFCSIFIQAIVISRLLKASLSSVLTTNGSLVAQIVATFISGRQKRVRRSLACMAIHTLSTA